MSTEPESPGPGYYDTPKGLWFIPAPNGERPLRGGAFLVIEQRDGTKAQVALNYLMLLRFGRAYSQLMENLTRSTFEAMAVKPAAFSEADIDAFVKSLDNPDAIPHKPTNEEK